MVEPRRVVQLMASKTVCAALSADGTVHVWGETLPVQRIASSLFRSVVGVADGGPVILRAGRPSQQMASSLIDEDLESEDRPLFSLERVWNPEAMALTSGLACDANVFVDHERVFFKTNVPATFPFGATLTLVCEEVDGDRV